jgi:cyclopropane-fatty-acyl-phospholipid synthase
VRGCQTDPAGLNPGLGFGEAYMERDLEVTEGSLWDLVEMVGRNRTEPAIGDGVVLRTIHAAERWLEQWNGRKAARRNVQHHYDLSLDLYRRFLDSDLQYSCAYFTHPGMSLEEAQAAKKAHLAAKLQLSAGHRVLDVGCGWGGLALELARHHPVRVTGVTLSTDQLTTSRARADAAGLAQRAQFQLVDYRDVEGPYDRIISVGMLEHVGAPNLRSYFQHIRRLLADDGVAVIHAIGSRAPPGVTQPFIRKHIFPGGYIPSLSEVMASIEKAGLWATDIEILRLHYAETVRHWRERFLQERSAIADLYDERFCRMWEIYLCMSELAFRYLNCMVFQIQLTRRVGVLPITRDYIYGREEADMPMMRHGWSVDEKRWSGARARLPSADPGPRGVRR